MGIFDIRKSILTSRNKLGSAFSRRRLENQDFTIISNDCWGGEVYKDLRLAYKSPFVGLFIMTPCYLKLLHELQEHMQERLVFTNASRYQDLTEQRKKSGDYPIGLLRDVELHFVHAFSQEEAAEKWNRRTERIAWDNLFIKMSGGNNACTDVYLEDFDRMPYKNKVCFVPTPRVDLASCVYVPNYVTNGARLYRKSLCHFDVINWLNGHSSELKQGHKLIYTALYTKGT
jgi:uncharacterized protein (DUF1919 family)